MQNKPKRFDFTSLFSLASFLLFALTAIAAIVFMVLSFTADIKKTFKMRDYRNNIESHLTFARETPYIDEMLSSMYDFTEEITKNKEKFSDSKRLDWSLFEVKTITEAIQKDTGLKAGDKLDDAKRRGFSDLAVEYSLLIRDIKDYDIKKNYEGYAETMMGVKNASDRFMLFFVLCLFSGVFSFILFINLAEKITQR